MCERVEDKKKERKKIELDRPLIWHVEPYSFLGEYSENDLNKAYIDSLQIIFEF